MKLPELLAPAGCLDGVKAAVQSGATAVYMGFGTFNARRGAKNFTKDEMEKAISYCRARGVKTNITFNILTFDREYDHVISDIKFLNDIGADALIVQDLGVASIIKNHAPEIEIHASTQMTIHNLDGAKVAKELGFSRVVLSRECTLEQIKYITSNTDIETEVFVHGALCMCYSGQCYLSSIIGKRSGNRGLCAQPCRLPYKYNESKKQCYPLSLKDLSLAGWLKPIVDAGVSSLKIEGRMKRPEYTAVVTNIYSKLLNEQRMPTNDEIKTLKLVFSRDGFTDGYFTNKKGEIMFGTKKDVPFDEVRKIYDEAANRFADGKEKQIVKVYMQFFAKKEGICLTVCDDDGNKQTVFDNAPLEIAKNKNISQEQIEKSLQKTGGTPFFVERDGISVFAEQKFMISTSKINFVRRQALENLFEMRLKPKKREWKEEKNIEIIKKEYENIEFIAMVQTKEQLEIVKKHKIKTIYAPLELAVYISGLIPVLPRIYKDDEQNQIQNMLEKCKKYGAQCVMITNIGQIQMANKMKMNIHGDFGLNIYNSWAMQEIKKLGIERQVLSFEQRIEQLRDLSKTIQTISIAYGYLPLMIFENCAIKRKSGKCICKKEICYLKDKQNKNFALLPSFGCRNELLNSQPLYMGDKISDLKKTGSKFVMLRFTKETAKQCDYICKNMMQGLKIDVPEGFTRGLYYRGVE